MCEKTDVETLKLEPYCGLELALLPHHQHRETEQTFEW